MDNIKNKKVVIIGSGFGGLGTAALLAKKGAHVTVLEKNEHLGGRANIFEAEGFRFDMGPSWYLMPDIFEQYFSLLGERVEEHLALKKLSPSYRIFFKNTGKEVDIYSDLTKDKETFEKLEPGSSEKLEKYLSRAKMQYDIAKARFIYKNYNSLLDFFTREIMTDGIKLSVFSTMDTYVKKYFATSEVQKIMQYPLVFLGSSPYNTPALYSIMSHIDFNMGVYYPQGGIYEIIKTLVRICEKHGVVCKTQTTASRIRTKNKEAIGVELTDGSFIEADIVVSNADIAHTEQKLLAKEERSFSEDYWEKRTLAPSAFILYLGVKDRIPSLTHHNLLFSQDWKKNFGEIFDTPQWPTDPSFYVCAPSVTDPSVAPEHHENLFVLVPIAAGLKDGAKEREKAREQVLATMEKEMHIPNLRERIVYEKSFCVSDFRDMYNAYQGTALGLAHTLWQTAIFRPDTQSKKVKNLFYVGGNTNPGIGMPMCLISAQLVYKRLTGDTSAEPLHQL
jgi:phytoene desaturase